MYNPYKLHTTHQRAILKTNISCNKTQFVDIVAPTELQFHAPTGVNIKALRKNAIYLTPDSALLTGDEKEQHKTVIISCNLDR